MFREWFDSTWTTIYFFFLRPMWKWIFRKATGKCEILRITLEDPKGAKRTKRIERCLRLSNITYLKQLREEEDPDVITETKEVMRIKDIVPEVHNRFEADFQVCLCHICGYKRLKGEVEQMRKTKYSSDDLEHEEKLMHLWDLLMPDTKLESRITKQWSDIGFQGDDPKTDFRGMGMLGLNQLLYFAIQYPEMSRKILSNSHHPKFGYSYAVVSINMTHICQDALMKGALRTHFYNLKDGRALLQDFHEVYCYVFYSFNKFWLEEKPKDIMEFGRVRDKFTRKLLHKLKSDHTAVLIADFQNKEQL